MFMALKESPIASSAFFLVIFYVADFNSPFGMPSILFRERTVVSLD